MHLLIFFVNKTIILFAFDLQYLVVK